jgi:hypothetical protein
MLGVGLLFMIGASAVAWISQHASRLTWIALFVLVLGGSLWLVARSFRPTPRPERADGAPRMADVTGLRIAIDAGVAPALVGAVQRALRLPEQARLAGVASALLETRPQWRFAALDATRPLPEAKAAKLFDAWARDVRTRFAPRGSLPPGDPFRSSALLVVCLHVETSEEIPDVSHADPDAVEKTLSYLQGRPMSVLQVDLWSSSEPLSASDLPAIDGTMRLLA